MVCRVRSCVCPFHSPSFVRSRRSWCSHDIRHTGRCLCFNSHAFAAIAPLCFRLANNRCRFNRRFSRPPRPLPLQPKRLNKGSGGGTMARAVGPRQAASGLAWVWPSRKPPPQRWPDARSERQRHRRGERYEPMRVCRVERLSLVP